jgi:formate-nitrite transporter family protein
MAMYFLAARRFSLAVGTASSLQGLIIACPLLKSKLTHYPLAHLPDQAWRPLIAGIGYCVGFLIVILGRQQLFTENTLTVVLPLLLRKDLSTLLRMLRLWVVVLGANLVGTFLFALGVGRIGIFDERTQQCLTEIAATHVGVGFGTVFVRSIFAGSKKIFNVPRF